MIYFIMTKPAVFSYFYHSK